MKGNLVEIDKELNTGKLRNIYFFYGEEKYDIQRYVAKILKIFGEVIDGVNFSNFDKNNIDKLESFCNTFSFFGTKKIAIVKDSGLRFDMEFIKDEEKLNDITIIFIEDSVDKRTVGYKTLSSIGYEIEFTYMKESELVYWVVSMFKAYKIEVSKDVSEYYISKVGTDKNNIINEMRKVVDYIDKDGKLTKDIVDKICYKSLNSVIFDLTDAIMIKNRKETIQILEELVIKKEPVQKIFITLYNQFKNLYLIKVYKINNRISDIASECKIHPFVIKKMLMHVDNYSKEKIEDILNKFIELDEQSKTGVINLEIGFKKLICEI